MTAPVTGISDSFDLWRANCNTVSSNVGDPATFSATDGSDTYNVTSTVTFAKDLMTKKVKRSGDTIANLTVTTTLGVGTNATVSGTLGVTGNVTFSGTGNSVGTITTGVWNGTAIGTTYGGTNLTSYAVGDTIYANGVNTLAKLAGNATATKKYMYMTSSVPGWSQLSTAEITDMSTWAGSSAITTLGTVATGTWNATTIATNKGGTGLSSIGAANYVLGVNNAAGGLEYKVLQSSGGSVNITHSAGVINLEASATASSSNVDTTLKVGQNALFGSLQSTGPNIHNSINTANTVEIRPGFGTTITNLLAMYQNNTGGSTTFAVTPAGNTTVGGTLGVTGASTFAAVSGTTVSASSTLSCTGNFSVNTNKFTANATSGNVAFPGDLAINSTMFTVAGASGNAATAGTLSVNNATNGTVFSINTNKLTVNGFNGNTAIAGTLGVTGVTTLTGGATVPVGSGTLGVGSSFSVSNAGAVSAASISSAGAINGTTISGSALSASGNSTLGTATPTTAIGNITSIGPNVDIATFALTTTSTSQVVLASLPAATYRSADFIIQAVDSTSSSFRSTTMKAIHDGAAASSTEFATLVLGSSQVASFTVDYSAGNMRLLVSPSSTNSTVFKVSATMIKA